MEMTDMNTSLVDTRAERATIPHWETNDNNDLPVRRGWFGRSFSLAQRDWKVLQATIDECKPNNSWSTRLGFTFSWKNPLLSPYLQRGVNLAAITFSYFSGALPFSSKIITGVSTAWEGVQWSAYPLRSLCGKAELIDFFPIFAALIIIPVRYLTEEWVDQNKDRDDKDYYNILMLTTFQALFLVNCATAYLFGKPEHDIKFQLENLQVLLKQYPQLETNLKLLHDNPVAVDNAFVDNEGKPILAPFYQVVEEGMGWEKRYLKLDELYTLLKTKESKSEKIYCDRARFETVLTIFKEAQTSNA